MVIQVLPQLLAKSIWHGLDVHVRSVFQSIEVYDLLASTQMTLCERDSIEPSLWRVCLAKQQTAGIGRQGRRWMSAQGQLTFSVRGWVSVSDPCVGLLSFAAALAIKDALLSFGLRELRLKWPNDLYCQNAKLAGLLISVCEQQQNQFDIVLGIGLNRLHLSLPPEAIALVDVMTNPPSLSDLTIRIIDAWLLRKTQLLTEAGCRQIVTDWLACAMWLNQQVRVILPTRQIEGVFVGVTEAGLLRVVTDSGEKVFAAGEVQLRAQD